MTDVAYGHVRATSALSFHATFPLLVFLLVPLLVPGIFPLIVRVASFQACPQSRFFFVGLSDLTSLVTSFDCTNRLYNVPASLSVYRRPHPSCLRHLSPVTGINDFEEAVSLVSLGSLLC